MDRLIHDEVKITETQIRVVQHSGRLVAEVFALAVMTEKKKRNRP